MLLSHASIVLEKIRLFIYFFFFHASFTNIFKGIIHYIYDTFIFFIFFSSV